MDVGKIDTSIIMCHYCEDEERARIALRCIQAVQPYRNKNTEFILVSNGHYDGLNDYCDQYFERDTDSSPGRSSNIGAKAARGNIFVFMCNDILLTGNWLEECKDILEHYPHSIAVPAYQGNRKYHEMPMIDGYCVNSRVGSDIMAMTREAYDDIGPFPEMNPQYDGSEYLNRKIAKGYYGMMTKVPLAFNLAPGIHSYLKQREKMGYSYKGR